MQSPGPVFSASQITTYMECARKWAWRTIAKVQAEQHPSAALGVRVHAHLERWLRDGTPITFTTPTTVVDGVTRGGEADDAGYIAATALPYLPPPKRATVEVEKHFGFLSPRTGFSYRGIIDWRAAGWHDVTSDGSDLLPTVGDHKTTSGLQWAKTAEDLEYDVQATIYAMDTMAYYQVPEVRAQWTYLQTRGARKALPVVTTLRSQPWVEPATYTRPEIEHLGVAKVFAVVEEVAAEMATTLNSVSKDQVLDLPPNPSACEAYGGCPYRSMCNLSPQERMRAVMSQGVVTNSLLARLQARKQAAAAAPAPGPSTIYPTYAKAVAEQMPASASEAYEQRAPELQAKNIQPVTDGQINPPEASPMASVTDVPSYPKPRRGRPRKSALTAQMDTVVQSVAESTATLPGPATAALLHKARVEAATERALVEHAPTLEKLAATPVVHQDRPALPLRPLPVGLVKDPTLAAAPSVFVPSTATLKIPTLYVDCIPLQGDILLAANIAHQANEKIAAETGKSDYRFLEYGQGPGALSKAALELVLDMSPVPSIALDSHTPEGAVMLSDFSANAAAIVRGLR